MQRVNENTKSCVCVGEKRSWNIETKETNSNLKTLNQQKQRVVLKYWMKGNKEALF